MRRIRLILMLVVGNISAVAQDSTSPAIKESSIAFGTFNTLSEDGVLQINPAISGFFGSFYFEARYGYESPNSASINFGKQVLKKSKHFYVVPMGGLIFGSFKGVTAELQSGFDYKRVEFSTDNQFSSEYTHNDSHYFSNWTVGRYKFNQYFHIGLTTSFIKTANQHQVFDKGATIAILGGKWTMRFYAFNITNKNTYYWLGLRYNLKMKFITK